MRGGSNQVDDGAARHECHDHENPDIPGSPAPAPQRFVWSAWRLPLALAWGAMMPRRRTTSKEPRQSHLRGWRRLCRPWHPTAKAPGLKIHTFLSAISGVWLSPAYVSQAKLSRPKPAPHPVVSRRSSVTASTYFNGRGDDAGHDLRCFSQRPRLPSVTTTDTKGSICV